MDPDLASDAQDRAEQLCTSPTGRVIPVMNYELEGENMTRLLSALLLLATLCGSAFALYSPGIKVETLVRGNSS